MKRLFRRSMTIALAIATLHCSSTVCLAQDDVSTGPAPLLRSEVNSATMRGVTDDTAAIATSVRILGVRAGANGSLVLRATIIDGAGNALRWRPGVGEVSVDVGCRGDATMRTPASSVDERTWTGSTPGTSAVILCDNSMLSGTTAKDVVRSLRDVLPGNAGRDSVSVVLFDHDLLELCPFMPTASLSDRLDPNAVASPEGLSAVYTAMMSGLGMVRDRAEQRVLILVTSSDDNASVHLSTADIVRRATELRAAVYVIRVGQTTRAYPFRSICAATGGRLYTVAESDAAAVGGIVREILYTTKQHLDVAIPSDVLTSLTCDDVWLRLRFEADTTRPVLTDSILVSRTERAYRTTPAIVATFSDTTEVGLQAFYPILATMAEQLMMDSTVRVELTGHVSADIRTNADERAMDRADYVKGFLVAYGVKKNQIAVRSDGSRRPLYYLQLDGAQRLLNNRVEARFLHADERPYTITVDQVATEEQAGKLADVWEQRGFKAYFEPVVINRAPAYRVKLWGYATVQDAQKDVAAIRRYNPKSSFIE